MSETASWCIIAAVLTNSVTILFILSAMNKQSKRIGVMGRLQNFTDLENSNPPTNSIGHRTVRK